MHPRKSRTAQLFASAAVALVLALPVAGCKTLGDDITGSIGTSGTSRSDTDWRHELGPRGERYRASPGDASAAIAYAQALRATDQRAQAVAVLEQATLRNPRNMQLLGDYGRALAETGQYKQALAALSRAQTPDNPDWRVLNAEGAVLDQMGRHADAQERYSAALKIVPNEPSVLSNLGLSYALTKELKQAEVTLRRAVAQPKAEPRVRQNLALVVGLQGRFNEAEKIARADLPEAEAEANVTYLREMLEKQGKLKSTKARHPYLASSKKSGT